MKVERTCKTCSRTFWATSKHLSCPACRRKANKIACPQCGQLMNHEYKRCTDCVPRDKENNPHWKGGKTRHKAGYVMVLARNHPRASSGYVFEHIVVMEEMIGRRLVDKENVHHKNGVKFDNRPENLELWSRPQPSGARVSDLVAWAITLLKRYAPEVLK